MTRRQDSAGTRTVFLLLLLPCGMRERSRNRDDVIRRPRLGRAGLTPNAVVNRTDRAK